MDITFIVWEIISAGFVALGICTLFSKKVRRYWANVSKKIEVTDVKKYNHAVGITWIVFGMIFALLGLPMLGGESSPLILISCIGPLFDCIMVMAALSMIEDKYEKRV